MKTTVASRVKCMAYTSPWLQRHKALAVNRNSCALLPSSYPPLLLRPPSPQDWHDPHPPHPAPRARTLPGCWNLEYNTVINLIVTLTIDWYKKAFLEYAFISWIMFDKNWMLILNAIIAIEQKLSHNCHSLFLCRFIAFQLTISLRLLCHVYR